MQTVLGSACRRQYAPLLQVLAYTLPRNHVVVRGAEKYDSSKLFATVYE